MGALGEPKILIFGPSACTGSAFFRFRGPPEKGSKEYLVGSTTGAGTSAVSGAPGDLR